MYESYFGLSERPFAPAPLADRYFPAASTDAARQTLARCAERAEGTGLLIGPPGIGKSLLLAVLADGFRERFRVAVLCGGGLETRRELLQAIVFELQLPYEARDEGELRLALVDHLGRGEHCPDGMLLLVDEAHALPTLLLEELRMITNLVRQGEPRVRLVLAGGMALEEKLADPALEALSQRLTARCYLDAFDRAETMDYVRFQVAVAGGKAEDIFEPAALEAVHQATGGVPRLVNQVCDHALLLACQGAQRPITAEGIQEAWADLQQLPAPWQGAPADDDAAQGSVVEFGGLDDVEPVAEEADSAESCTLTEFAADAAAGENSFEGLHPETAAEEAGIEAGGPQPQVAGFSIEADAPLEAADDDDLLEDLVVQDADGEEPPVDEALIDQHVDGALLQSGQTQRDAETALNRIQQQVEALGDETAAPAPDAADDHQRPTHQEPVEPAVAEPAGDAGLGWTLSFEDFDEEEVLFDPYAQLDSQQQAAPRPAAATGSAQPEADAPADADADEPADLRESQHRQPAIAQTADAGEPAADVHDDSADAADDVHWNVGDHPLEVVVDPYAGLRDTDHHPSALAAAQGARARIEAEDAHEPEDDLDIEINDVEQPMPDEHLQASAADEAPSEDVQSTIPLSEVIRIRHDAEFTDEPRSRDVAADEASTSSAETLPRSGAGPANRQRDAGARQGASAEATGDDLIVLEDGDEAGATPPPRVERQDYRRLFARLRNG